MRYKKKKIQKRNFIDKVISSLRKRDLPLCEFLALLEQNEERFFDNTELELELLLSNGFPIEITDDKVILTTKKCSLEDQIFCVVDIETNGNNIKNGQIIELGAVKYLNGEIIDKYESLVYAKDIPKFIQEVTNIKPKMLEDAPVLKVVLEEFKLFLEDHVFVAHDIKFDYKFISDSFEQYDLGKLENRKLCTIDLARRTIEAQRYGLDFLKELLNIDIENQHRAFSDALSTSYILKESLSKISNEINTTEKLIDFSKSDNLIIKNKPQ